MRAAAAGGQTLHVHTPPSGAVRWRAGPSAIAAAGSALLVSGLSLMHPMPSPPPSTSPAPSRQEGENGRLCLACSWQRFRRQPGQTSLTFPASFSVLLANQRPELGTKVRASLQGGGVNGRVRSSEGVACQQWLAM